MLIYEGIGIWKSKWIKYSHITLRVNTGYIWKNGLFVGQMLTIQALNSQQSVWL